MGRQGTCFDCSGRPSVVMEPRVGGSSTSTPTAKEKGS